MQTKELLERIERLKQASRDRPEGRTAIIAEVLEALVRRDQDGPLVELGEAHRLVMDYMRALVETGKADPQLFEMGEYFNRHKVTR